MKSTLFTILLFGGLICSAICHAQHWQWGRGSSCSSHLGGSEGWLVRTDPSDNVFLAGFYYGDSICFGPVTYHNLVNPANNVQTVVVKYDSAGNLLWSHAGSHGYSRPISITTDHKGNLYIFGYFTTDSIRFDDQLLTNPSFDISHPERNNCYFLLKYNDIGALQWAVNGTENFHPDGDYLKPGGIAADAAGDVYIASTFNSDTFRTGATELINANQPDSSNDIFVAKYNTSGSLLWARSFGGSKNDYVLDVASSGNKVFITGYFKSGFISFDSYKLFNSSQKGYIACMDLGGSVIWANSTGGKGTARTAAPDHKGNVYVAGGFRDTLSFDTYDIIKTNGGYFLTPYDSNGKMHTPRIVTPTETMTGCCNTFSVATDICNNVWVSLNMEVNKGLVLDAGTTVFPPAGSVDPIVIAGYNANDSLFDHVALPSAGGYNTGLSNTGLATDSKGTVLFAGDFRAVDPLVIGPDSLHLYPGAQNNMFVASYRPQMECVEGPPPVYPAVPIILVYPDPARADCILSYTGNLGTGATMALRDIAGKLIRTYPLTAQLTPFSVADLPCGVYLCMISVTGRDIYTLRLVVIR